MKDDVIIELLTNVHTVAVVGLSPKPDRPSHRVSKYLQEFSYTIVPVRPGAEKILGQQAYKSLEDIPFKVDLVNVFRASGYVPEIVDSCIKLGINKIWLQEGIINLNAQKKAHQAGVSMVMDRCIYKEMIRLGLNRNTK